MTRAFEGRLWVASVTEWFWVASVTEWFWVASVTE